MGDLNYRINLSYDDTKILISKKDWAKLVEKDQVYFSLPSYLTWQTLYTLSFPFILSPYFWQLAQEIEKGVFVGWSEGTLTFAPTYKYEKKSDKYVGEDPKVGRRTPAWYASPLMVIFLSFSECRLSHISEDVSFKNIRS